MFMVRYREIARPNTVHSALFLLPFPIASRRIYLWHLRALAYNCTHIYNRSRNTHVMSNQRSIFSTEKAVTASSARKCIQHDVDCIITLQIENRICCLTASLQMRYQTFAILFYGGGFQYSKKHLLDRIHLTVL